MPHRGLRAASRKDALALCGHLLPLSSANSPKSPDTSDMELSQKGGSWISMQWEGQQNHYSAIQRGQGGRRTCGTAATTLPGLSIPMGVPGKSPGSAPVFCLLLRHTQWVAGDSPSVWVPINRRGDPDGGSWFLAPAWPSSGWCSHFGHGLMDRRSLHCPLFLCLSDTTSSSKRERNRTYRKCT